MGILQGYGGNTFGRKTASAGTAILRLLQPSIGGFTRLAKLIYTAGATAHTITVLRSLGRTVVAEAAAAGQPIVALAANPGPVGNGIAANDYIAIREIDNVTRLYVVQSVSDLDVTLTTNLVMGAAPGFTAWTFGVPGDTDPKTGEAHQTFATVADETTTLQDDVAGVAAGNAIDEPLLVHVNNATNAGSIDLLSYVFTAN